MATSHRRPVYLDCDTGIDDALALSLLLASPEVDLVGVGTVSGNVDADQAAQNSLDLLALAGRHDIPVAVGARDFTIRPYQGGVAHIHGTNGIGDVELPSSGRTPVPGTAVELLTRLARQYPGELTVVTIGPLTNLAEALRQEPTLPSLVHQVVSMAGAALVPGNVSPVAEANVGNDPEAAATVISAPWPVVLVPLDVTLENTLSEAERHRLLAAKHPLPQALGQILDLYFDFYVDLYGERSSALHDPTAAAIAIGMATPAAAPLVDVVVDVTDGPGRGQTICDLRGQRLGPVDQPGAHVRVVLSLTEKLGPLLTERLVTYPGTPTSDPVETTGVVPQWGGSTVVAAR